MQQRNPIGVALLSLVTIGIYAIVWFVKTKGEMNERGAEIPTAWLLIVPFVNFYWLWKYSQGVEKVSAEKMTAPVAFILLWLTSIVGQAIVQDTFNKVGTASGAAAEPAPPGPPPGV